MAYPSIEYYTAIKNEGAQDGWPAKMFWNAKWTRLVIIGYDMMPYL